ncbi:hypothetical protein K440DRAFT_661468 [Wilcoxina mikolae CBS 423.85]|nr:hypothetical protein K440DRAFT_661468 [Wilcoxina mikolae CBS 423.85]
MRVRRHGPAITPETLQSPCIPTCVAAVAARTYKAASQDTPNTSPIGLRIVNEMRTRRDISGLFFPTSSVHSKFGELALANPLYLDMRRTFREAHITENHSAQLFPQLEAALAIPSLGELAKADPLWLDIERTLDAIRAAHITRLCCFHWKLGMDMERMKSRQVAALLSDCANLALRYRIVHVEGAAGYHCGGTFSPSFQSPPLMIDRLPFQ